MKGVIITICFLLIFIFSSCESKQSRRERLAYEEREQIGHTELREKERIEQERRSVEERFDRERQAREREIELRTREEQELKEREVYNKYISNYLQTGTTPYRSHYGSNSSCNGMGCSRIKVRAPNNSDVIVTIKSKNKVVRHAYIRAGGSYTFEMPNGTYQPFFYYGKGWNPEKEMKRANNTTIFGGFVSNELFGKDSLQRLNNNTLEYEIIFHQNGNLSTIPSNSMEAL